MTVTLCCCSITDWNSCMDFTMFGAQPSPWMTIVAGILDSFRTTRYEAQDP